MIRRYVVLGVVWVGCTVAWMLLGATLLVRSGETSSALVNEVHQLWGPPLDQVAPGGQYTEQRPREERRVLHDANGRPYETTVQTMEDVFFPVPLVSTRARVLLALEHRQKGLLWFPTYAADFQGRYAVENDTAVMRAVTVSFPLPAQGAIYDGFEVLDEKGQAIRAEVDGGSAHWVVSLAPSARHDFQVRYRTRGTSSWTYRPAGSGSSIIRDFSLEIRSTARGIDFSPGSISPSRAASEGSGWRGSWEFRSLVGSAPISLELPQKTNPGPLAARITFFAPVALLFYFFVVGLLAEGRGHRLHPISWFLIGCAFFADHLLFAYLADHVPLWVALTLSSAVSILLAVTYAQWLVGWRFALREMGLAQLVYLVGFSLTFLLKGFTGLSITVGAILTLFLMMQVTGRRVRSDVPRAELVA
ncbi:MAG TPA: inner membrane CreD family protein [Myxococcaceae bacterium]